MIAIKFQKHNDEKLLKVIKKYRMHFNEHPNLYINIINEFGNWYGEMEDNININSIKKTQKQKSKRTNRKKWNKNK